MCESQGVIAEFRAKLPALLPITLGASIFLLLREKGDPVDTTHLTAIGVFGFTVTVGLFLHELRGIGHTIDDSTLSLTTAATTETH